MNSFVVWFEHIFVCSLVRSVPRRPMIVDVIRLFVSCVQLVDTCADVESFCQGVLVSVIWIR